MKSIQSLLTTMSNALVAVEGLNAYHYTKPEKKNAPYCVWAENGEGDSFHSDNHLEEQVLIGVVDYYFKGEFDPMVDKIQEALDGVCAFELQSVQYEDSTKLIHYSWTWEMS